MVLLLNKKLFPIDRIPHLLCSYRLLLMRATMLLMLQILLLFYSIPAILN